MLTHFSLFTGIGGIDLASEWAGFQTVGQCEFADYPTKVLEKHWPNVPRWRDVRDVTAESVRARGVGNITLISGGFPCQPFSVAGKQRGTEDDRFLWPEMCRVISELKPTWVLGENVPGIIPLALDQVLTDLESLGYSCQTFNIPACAVDTPHRRARIFIVANASSNLRRTSRNEGSGSFDGSCSNVANAESQQNIQRGRSDLDETIRRRESFNSTAFLSSEDVAYSNNSGLQVTGLESRESKISSTFGTQYGGWWPTEPDVGRVAHGVPARVDRLKCLGNAVVSQQVYPILKAIADIEMGDI